MSDDSAPRYEGVADEDVVAPRGCRGCVAAGHAVAHRDANGRLMPGHTANALGRPSGRPNDRTRERTREANALLKAHAETAAKVIVDGLSSPVEWVKYAAKTILERTLPKDAGDGEPPDLDLIRWATDEELEQVSEILARCERRREAGAVAGGDAMDATPRDAFSLASLPAPGEQPEPIEQQPEPDADAEEFP